MKTNQNWKAPPGRPRATRRRNQKHCHPVRRVTRPARGAVFLKISLTRYRAFRDGYLPHGSINTNEKEDKEKKVTGREQYAPGPASGAQVRKDGEKWTLILVRELRHSPEKVWQALTDPAHLREWAPFDAD